MYHEISDYMIWQLYVILQDLDRCSFLKNKSFKYLTSWIAGSFPEKYQHLPMKHAFGFSWIAKHCDNAKYVLKADDDVIVNLPYLQTVLNVSPLRRAIVGRKFSLLLGRMIEKRS